jgi:hypothetical protein
MLPLGNLLVFLTLKTKPKFSWKKTPHNLLRYYTLRNEFKKCYLSRVERVEDNEMQE